jgi:hypothetical protein
MMGPGSQTASRAGGGGLSEKPLLYTTFSICNSPKVLQFIKKCLFALITAELEHAVTSTAQADGFSKVNTRGSNKKGQPSEETKVTTALPIYAFRKEKEKAYCFQGTVSAALLTVTFLKYFSC